MRIFLFNLDLYRVRVGVDDDRFAKFDQIVDTFAKERQSHT